MMRDELRAVRQLVDAVLEADRFPACIQPDFLREAVLAYPQRPGKSLRPALLIWCCELVEGNRRLCPNAAAAVELYHNWTLIHDDIIDRDDTRRGGPACHRLVEQTCGLSFADSATAAEFARNQAMLAGDILHGWSMNLLVRTTEDGLAADVAAALVAHMSGLVTPLLVSGEALDVQFEQSRDVSPERVLAMLRLKTAILLRFAAEAGTVIGLGIANFANETVQNAGHFAEAAGLAFQLQDDILGLFGDEDRLKKPVASDVRAGKPTLLYLDALARASTDDAQVLHAALGKPDLGGTEVGAIRTIVRDCGALDHVKALAAEHISRARETLHSFPHSTARDRLEAWTSRLVERQS